ncbi:MAG: RpiB/LacA/LacB family sugar-phosphate isomerase [Enterocloster asparagiformis]|nr:RpiB/LacA/LacB family sugar-phosphate isomerase [Enterocloster asparagiformis]
MRIALMNEWSQAGKNELIFRELAAAAKAHGHVVYNVGMKREGDEPELTYIHLGLMAAVLLNSGAVDFVVTGCGTGEGAMISLNNYPGVVCGLVLEPVDAYLFCQINNGNAVSLPYAKGFGWGAELNLRGIFERILSCGRGNGYPPDKKQVQNRNVAILSHIKSIVNKDMMTILREMDRDVLLTACKGEEFRRCLYGNSQAPEICDYIRRALAEPRP